MEPFSPEAGPSRTRSSQSGHLHQPPNPKRRISITKEAVKFTVGGDIGSGNVLCRHNVQVP